MYVWTRGCAPGGAGTGAALLAMAGAGVKLTGAQLSELAKHDKKAAKRIKKEVKKVGGWGVRGG